jgi:hypothetical protein
MAVPLRHKPTIMAPITPADFKILREFLFMIALSAVRVFALGIRLRRPECAHLTQVKPKSRRILRDPTTAPTSRA